MKMDDTGGWGRVVFSRGNRRPAFATESTVSRRLNSRISRNISIVDRNQNTVGRVGRTPPSSGNDLDSKGSRQVTALSDESAEGSRQVSTERSRLVVVPDADRCIHKDEERPRKLGFHRPQMICREIQSQSTNAIVVEEEEHLPCGPKFIGRWHNGRGW